MRAALPNMERGGVDVVGETTSVAGRQCWRLGSIQGEEEEEDREERERKSAIGFACVVGGSMAQYIEEQKGYIIEKENKLSCPLKILLYCHSPNTK